MPQAALENNLTVAFSDHQVRVTTEISLEELDLLRFECDLVFLCLEKLEDFDGDV